ncbi:phospholipase D family protein [Isoptericola sp. b441]|uniref:Phospholipase D family protein n=1 Tax=Actinotalea lenta TaxID=3064654 RepID=A0ABT9DDJ5_9CELL|nr:phospholipase D family protein [Isoptericola sp. b441]MDO8108323.1 phospholipase D family protein [Isoptericola sp. b441]
MLAPDARVLLTDALRPPDGYRVEIAVGTTFSLDLMALLLAPISFALIEHGDSLAKADPAALLAALRQYSERTTVFCQAGGIAVPGEYRRVLTFAEDCVHEVVAPDHDRLFHPKVWALRFASDEGVRHRLVVLSRNLTFDRSWDTALVLDEADDGPTVEGARAADFIAALPDLCVRTLPAARHEQVESIVDSLRQARLGVPHPFDSAELLPLGLGEPGHSPTPPSADRLLVISPFLDATAVATMGRASAECHLVSRADTFARLGGDALAGWRTSVLSSYTESGDSEAASDPDGGQRDTVQVGPGTGRGPWVAEGLHAKVAVADIGSRAQVATGSANMTSAGWGGNVEFSVRLEGPVGLCGVKAMLGSGTDGLAPLLEEITPEPEAAKADPREETERALETLHRRLAAAYPTVEVGDVDGDVTSIEVRLPLPEHLPGETRIWPITLRPDAHAQPLAASVSWPEIAISAVTPFVAVETTAGTGDARVTRRCVLKAELVGDPPERQQGALRDLLRDVEAVVRYLALLLAEPELGGSIAFADAAARDLLGGTDSHPWTSHDIVLFEPLIRAAVRDSAAIGRIAQIVDELREVGGLLPDGFDQLWTVVREFVAEEAGA